MRDRLDKREVAKKRVSAHRAIGARAATGCRHHCYAISSFEGGDRPRGDIPNAALESRVPIGLHLRPPDRVESQRNIRPSFSGPLAHDHLSKSGGLSPVKWAGGLAGW